MEKSSLSKMKAYTLMETKQSNINKSKQPKNPNPYLIVNILDKVIYKLRFIEEGRF